LLAAPDGPPIAAVARRVGLSRSRFSVVFAAAMGCAPQAWREAKRLDRAAELLAHSFLAVADIAAQTGFADPFYLSRRFRARFGESPSAWRARRLAP
jgi:transcriptional regulator GlxA family with amidase domain